MMKILITGATGFVGQRLVDYLLEQTEHELQLVVRTKPIRDFGQGVSLTMIHDISNDTNWHDALLGCEVVVHIAARVHVMDETEDDPLTAFRSVNVSGTLNLARQAIKAGVKRFIYISSIKVNGEKTSPGKPFNADSSVGRSTCPYAMSKYEAEQGLMSLAEASGIEVVILRPTLVYGPGVKGNFQSMMRWLQKGIPLPLGRINNKRSFVSVDNLVDLITTCLTHPRASNQLFLVSDGHDLSTTELLQKLSLLLGRRAIFFAFPAWMLKGMAKMVRKTHAWDRLCGSLQVDIRETCERLNWRPVVHVDDALRETVEAYLRLETNLYMNEKKGGEY